MLMHCNRKLIIFNFCFLSLKSLGFYIPPWKLWIKNKRRKKKKRRQAKLLLLKMKKKMTV